MEKASYFLIKLVGYSPLPAPHYSEPKSHRIWAPTSTVSDPTVIQLTKAPCGPFVSFVYVFCVRRNDGAHHHR